MANRIIQGIKRRKEGLLGGAILGAFIAFYMKFQGVDFMATVQPGGLIEKVVTVSPADMAFLKILITAVALGALLGYIIQDRFFK